VQVVSRRRKTVRTSGFRAPVPDGYGEIAAGLSVVTVVELTHATMDKMPNLTAEQRSESRVTCWASFEFGQNQRQYEVLQPLGFLRSSIFNSQTHAIVP
jgi:hypothetical protein